MEEKKVNEPKKKNPLQKLKEGLDDKEEQLQVLSTFVRLGVVVWSGFILTLAYVDLPGFQKQNFDPTFIASVFTGALSTFGLATTKDKKSNGLSKEDVQKMLATSSTAQTIRVETPIKITGAEVVKVDPITKKPIDPVTGKLT